MLQTAVELFRKRNWKIQNLELPKSSKQRVNESIVDGSTPTTSRHKENQVLLNNKISIFQS